MMIIITDNHWSSHAHRWAAVRDAHWLHQRQTSPDKCRARLPTEWPHIYAANSETDLLYTSLSPGLLHASTLPLVALRSPDSRRLQFIHTHTNSEETKQVAQLRQSYRTKLAFFAINAQLHSKNPKIVFLSHPMGASMATWTLYLKALMQRNFVAEFYQENVSFIPKNKK